VTTDRPLSEGGVDDTALDSLRALDDDDDPDFYGRVLRKFLAQGDQVLQDLRRALAEHDTAAIARAAHGWKGSSGQLGLRRVYDACVEAEMAAKRGDVGAAGASVAAAAEAFARARPRLEKEAAPKA
jgi:HPt (histidine-containing phosphotransfer) domain-containing protein